ncbi:MAG: hypothetical protein J6B53_00085 [Clostridia bacterium]|nr:hypothetical protein [Clostridia bacterium]
MKKCIGMILVAAMLMLAGAAFAEGPGGNMGGMPPMQGGPQQGNAPQMNGPAPSDQQGNQPQMNGQAPNGQQPGNAPQMNGQAPNGQQPGNAPQMNGQAPNGQQPGNAPQMNGQAPNGQQPGNAPQMNGQTPNGQMPMNPPQMDGNGPEMKMIDFDAMAENSVISDETLAKIKAYMEENKPAEMNAQQPMNGMPPEKPETDGEKTDADPEVKKGLLEDLLSAGIITQEEYEALNAAQ